MATTHKCNLQRVLKAGSGGRIFSAEFITKKGKRRVFNGRLAQHSHQGKSGGTLGYNATEKKLICAFDMARYKRRIAEGLDNHDAAKKSYIMINIPGLEVLNGKKVNN